MTNLRHEAGQLNDFSRVVLCHLDGKHDRTSLLRILGESRDGDQVVLPTTIREVGDHVTDAERAKRWEAELGPKLNGCLSSLVSMDSPDGGGSRRVDTPTTLTLAHVQQARNRRPTRRVQSEIP